MVIVLEKVLNGFLKASAREEEYHDPEVVLQDIKPACLVLVPLLLILWSVFLGESEVADCGNGQRAYREPLEVGVLAKAEVMGVDSLKSNLGAFDEEEEAEEATAGEGPAHEGEV